MSESVFLISPASDCFLNNGLQGTSVVNLIGNLLFFFPLGIKKLIFDVTDVELRGAMFYKQEHITKDIIQMSLFVNFIEFK